MKKKKHQPVFVEAIDESESSSGESPMKFALWIFGLPLGVIIIIMIIQSIL